MTDFTNPAPLENNESDILRRPVLRCQLRWFEQQNGAWQGISDASIYYSCSPQCSREAGHPGPCPVVVEAR